MNNTFLGVPPLVWGILCLGVATMYYFVWPQPGANTHPRPAWMRLVLRWFHSLVWLLLAIACFLWMGEQPRIADLIARLALLLYVLFIVTVAIDRRKQPAD